jgi:hypothetical protein
MSHCEVQYANTQAKIGTPAATGKPTLTLQEREQQQAKQQHERQLSESG